MSSNSRVAKPEFLEVAQPLTSWRGALGGGFSRRSLLLFSLLRSACLVLALTLSGATLVLADVTNTTYFTYTSRKALLADGWSFVATTAAGASRNTEATNGVVVSYDQGVHPGTLRIPCDQGDLWGGANNSRNSLFRNLPTNWVSLRLDVSLTPTITVQQVQLALYQDDDNYLEVGHVFNASLGGELITLVQEDGGVQGSFSPRSLSRQHVSASHTWLRLDRDVLTDQVTGLYSLDGTNWTSLGWAWQALPNPRICIWAGDSSGYFVPCDVRQLDIVTSDTPLNPVLIAQPQHLVFNTIAGQSNTGLQQLRVVTRRSPASLGYTVRSDSPWLQVTPVQTNTPGFCDIGVNPTGLAAGTYQGTLTLSAPGALPTTATVSLLVNPACRAQVATWRGAKAGAMTVWVDDAQPSGFDELATNGFAGTYLLWGNTPTPSSHYIPSFVTNYYQAGMELGGHTVDHICLTLDEPAIRFELEANIASILASTPQPSNTLLSFAFPCGLAPIPAQVSASDYFLAVHGYNLNQFEEPNPYNFLYLKCYNSHEHYPYPPADFKPLVDAAVAQGKWLNLVLHAFNNTDGAIAYAKGKDIWVAPGGVVTKYIQQRQRTLIANYQESPDQISFSFSRLPLESSSLRSFETAVTPQDLLTFQVDITGTNAAYSVAVDGQPAPVSVRTGGGRSFILFETQVTTNWHTALLQPLPNRPPMLPLASSHVVNQFTTLLLTNAATDPDLPLQDLSYRLVNPPTGAQIDNNGIVQWTPGAAQGPGTYSFATVVTDSGSPALSATNHLNVLVQPQNCLLLPPVTNAIVIPGQMLLVTNAALYTRSLNPWQTNSLAFTYSNRTALLADGWSFIATTPGVGLRNTEVNTGAVVSYDQLAHPGTLRIPCDQGDLWAANNTSRNALFRSLPTNWVSAQLGLDFAPSQNVQQVQLSLYQDDNDYLQAGFAFNSGSLGGQAATVIFETNGSPVNAFAGLYAASSLYLRLDRDTLSSNVTALFSLDRSTWTRLGAYRPAFANPRLSIWTGGSPVPWTNGLPCVDLRQLTLVLSNDTSPNLTYALLDPPPGATIDSNGLIQWSPAPGQPAGPYTFSTVVTDHPLGLESISTTNSFTVTLASTNRQPPLISTVTRQPDGTLRVLGAGQPYQLYMVQASTNLLDWTTLSTGVAGIDGIISFLDPSSVLSPVRYYRLHLP